MISPAPVGSPQYLAGGSINQSLTLNGGDLLMAVITCARDIDPGTPTWNGKALIPVYKSIHPSSGFNAISAFVLKDYDWGTHAFVGGAPDQNISLSIWANVASFYGAGGGENGGVSTLPITQTTKPNETAVLVAWSSLSMPSTFIGTDFMANSALNFRHSKGAYVIATGSSTAIEFRIVGGYPSQWNEIHFVLRPILQNKGCVMWI